MYKRQAKTGMDISLASHKDYQPNDKVMEKVNKVAEESGSKIVITEDPLEAAKDADILYTDALVSTGEDEIGQRKLKAVPYTHLDVYKRQADMLGFVYCIPVILF